MSTKNDDCALAEAVRSTCRSERVQNNLSLEHDVFALADAVRSTCTSGMEPGNLKRGSFALALEGCTTFGQLGCLLCWWIIGGWQIPDTESFTQEFFGSWLNLSVAKAQSSRTRSRGSTFPIRKGDLHAIEEVFGSEQLADVCKESFVSVWSRQAWTYVTLSSLNKLVGSSASLPAGKWSSAERRVFESVEKAVKIRLSKDDSAFQLSEAAWKKELEGRHVGYNVEEITTCQPLSLDQILPSLPPEEHGGCIDCLDWVGLRTKELLLHPEKLLLPEDQVTLPRMPGKIHINEGDKSSIANELVKRRICEWIPLSKVNTVRGVRVLNGLFGVAKPSKISDGRAVLRVIMNLTGSNATQRQIEGGCSGLPAITSWQSIIVEGSEQLKLFQSDMCSAFYLFKLPAVWRPHLAFNIAADGNDCGGDPGTTYVLSCSVIPMGWTNSVSVMQEISENLLRQGTLKPQNQVVRGQALPPWFTTLLSHAARGDKAWWHIYLDNFCAGERTWPGDPSTWGEMCHQAAEKCWREAGVISSEKKRVSASRIITELGAEASPTLS